MPHVATRGSLTVRAVEQTMRAVAVRVRADFRFGVAALYRVREVAPRKVCLALVFRRCLCAFLVVIALICRHQGPRVINTVSWATQSHFLQTPVGVASPCRQLWHDHRHANSG